MRPIAHIVLLSILTIGQIPADGQTLMRRYDAWGQGMQEFAFGVEAIPSGAVVILGSALIVDSLFYASVVTTLTLDNNGIPTDTNLFFLPLKGTYPGWANVSFQLSNGGIGVGGSTYDTSGTQRSALYLFNGQGVPQAMYEYGVQGEEWIGRQGKQTPDGGYVIAGETSVGGTVDAFLLKIDSAGIEEWTQVYIGPVLRDYARSVDLAPDNGYYIGGQQEVSQGIFDPWVLRVDSMGNVLWEETFGTVYDDAASAQVTTLADGNIAFATSWATANNLRQLGLAKIDPNGNEIWSFTYDAPWTTPFLNVVKEVVPDGDLIACGYSSLPGYFQGALLRTAANGDSLWLRYYHYYDSLWTEGKGAFRDVEPLPNGGFIAVGSAFSSSNNPNDPPVYTQDLWVVKVDSMGCLVPGCDTVTGITSYTTNLKDALTLAPNPASDMVRLSWELPQGLRSGKVTLSVVNSTGGLVRTEQLELSQNSYQIDVSDWASGIYYLHLVSEGVWVTGGKLVVE